MKTTSPSVKSRSAHRISASETSAMHQATHKPARIFRPRQRSLAVCGAHMSCNPDLSEQTPQLLEALLRLLFLALFLPRQRQVR